MNCREEGRKGLPADSVHAGVMVNDCVARAEFLVRSLGGALRAWNQRGMHDFEEASGADHISAVDGGGRDPAVLDWPPTDNGRRLEFWR